MLLFRDADLDDIDAIVALVTSAYRGDASHVGWTTEAELIDGPRTDAGLLADELADPNGRLLVGLEEGEIVACCNLVRKSDDVGYFGLFAVRPGRQGAGLGKQVMAEAERICRDEWGVSQLEMTVLEPRTELIDYYVRRGFALTGEFSPFPHGDPRYGTPRDPGLRMVVLRKAL